MGSIEQIAREQRSKAQKGSTQGSSFHRFFNSILRIYTAAAVFASASLSDAATGIAAQQSSQEFKNPLSSEREQIWQDRGPHSQVAECISGSSSVVANFCTKTDRLRFAAASTVCSVSAASSKRAEHVAARAATDAGRPIGPESAIPSTCDQLWCTDVSSFHVCKPNSSSRQLPCSWDFCRICWSSNTAAYGSGPNRILFGPPISAAKHCRSSLDFCCKFRCAHATRPPSACASCTDATCCTLSGSPSTSPWYSGFASGHNASFEHTCTRWSATGRLGRANSDVSQSFVQKPIAATTDVCTNHAGPKQFRCPIHCTTSCSSLGPIATQPRRDRGSRFDTTATTTACRVCRTATTMPATATSFQEQCPAVVTQCPCSGYTESCLSPSDSCYAPCASDTSTTAIFPCFASATGCQCSTFGPQFTRERIASVSQCRGASRALSDVTSRPKGPESCQNPNGTSAFPISHGSCSQCQPGSCSRITSRIYVAYTSAHRDCRERRRSFFRSKSIAPTLGIKNSQGGLGQVSDGFHDAGLSLESSQASRPFLDLDLVFEPPRTPPEQLVAHSTGHCSQSCVHRKVLCLDQLLHWTCEEILLHESQYLFATLCEPWPKTSCFWTLNFVDFLPDMPTVSSSWIRSTPLWTGCDVKSVHIYVDGSSFPSNRPSPSCDHAGWAFIVLVECAEPSNDMFQFFCASCGPLVASSDISPSVDVGELLHDSLSAEATAMIWTLAWVCQSPFAVPTHIHFDNMTVGMFTAGLHSWHASWEYVKLSTALTNLRQCLQVAGRVLPFEHQKSHCNHPWSDLVDAVAKAVAKSILFPMDLPSHVSRVVKHPAFKFTWLTMIDAQTVPKPSALVGTFKSEGPFGKQPIDVSWDHDPGHSHTEAVRISLTCVTANVLTLSPGPKNRQVCGLMDKGRISSLQAQFASRNFGIIGLQECRTQGQQVRHSSSHFVFQSGASAEGARGCELWIDRTVPYAVSKRHSYVFQTSHFHVAAFTDRLLMVVVRAPHLSIRILVIHAPHEVATDWDFNDWWNELGRLVSTIAPQLPLIVLGDTNSRLGSVTSDAVSDHDRENETLTGHCLHAFLLEHNLWAPATYSNCHQGPSSTWVASNGNQHRIDFVILPCAWRSFQVSSWVTSDVDLITAKDDHFPAAVQVLMQAGCSTFRKTTRTHLDRQKLSDPDAVEGFCEYLHQPPDIPWNVGVGSHVQQLTHWMQKGAKQFFSKSTKRPRQRYMSEVTWNLIQIRKQLLKMSNRSFQQAHRISLRLWFLRWASSVFSGQTLQAMPNEAQLQSLHRTCQFSAMWTLQHRNRLHAAARSSSKKDRIACAQSIVSDFYLAAKGHDSRALCKALRPLLGQADRRNVQPFRPLPAVRLEDGVLAPTAEAAQHRWQSHFAESEQGIAVSCSQLQELAAIQFRTYPCNAFSMDLQSLPSLADVEQYLRKAKRHKAPGIDGLVVELYQIDAPFMARLLWPLLAKCTLRCSEPLQWKGGEVFALPKTRVASFQVDKYRSILLADFSSKVRHGIVRSKLLPSFLDFKETMQAGGIPRLCPDFLTLYVQSFSFWTRTQGLSSAFLFVDIKQAFYRACRSLVSYRPVSDVQLVQLFKANNWSAEMLHDFKKRLAEPDALQQAGVSPHLQAQVSDLLTTTWFQLKGDGSSLTHTEAGTRPGDSIADLLYAFVMSRYIKAIRAQFVQHGLHLPVDLHWIPACRLSPGDVDPTHVVQACWVDDLVLMMSSADPQTLLAKLQCAARIVQDTAVEFSLQLNYSRDKTSALLSLRGSKARATWTELLTTSDSSTTLPFTCRSCTMPVQLHIVPDYVYLGTLLDSTGHVAAEVKRRFLAVQPMKRMLNKNIFKAPQLPGSTRHLIFRSLVISRLIYGAGAWQPMNVLTLRSFCTQLVQLYHFLVPHLKPAVGVTRLDFVASSAQPHPLLLLASSRLSLFDRLAQADQSELFAVLQSQDQTQGWFHSIRQPCRMTISLRLLNLWIFFPLPITVFALPWFWLVFANRCLNVFRPIANCGSSFAVFRKTLLPIALKPVLLSTT